MHWPFNAPCRIPLSQSTANSLFDDHETQSSSGAKRWRGTKWWQYGWLHRQRRRRRRRRLRWCLHRHWGFGPSADDVAAMASTMVVEFEPGDVLGKLLAYINQVRMSSEGVRAYLDHVCALNHVKAVALRLWVRSRWGSMSNCLESALCIQKVCLFSK